MLRSKVICILTFLFILSSIALLFNFKSLPYQSQKIVPLPPLQTKELITNSSYCNYTNINKTQEDVLKSLQEHIIDYLPTFTQGTLPSHRVRPSHF